MPLYSHDASRWGLYPHQLEAYQKWDSCTAILISSTTGTGKTRAAMLPVLRRAEQAVAVYPTNELLRDQVRAVTRMAIEEGFKPLVWMPEIWDASDRLERYAEADVVLVPIDADLLDKWQNSLHCKSRGETLRAIMSHGKPTVVFTNPDILFLVLGFYYHAEPVAALRPYETVMLDEFHLYRGVELAHALAMLALARGLGCFKRVVMLSATPDPAVKELLRKAVDLTEITGECARGRLAGERIAVHEVEVVPLLISDDPVEMLVSELKKLKNHLESLRNFGACQQGRLPAVVILDSVMKAIRLEDRLCQEGFPRESLGIIRGLSNRSIRETSGKLVAIGTSAIEVGVDFQCDYLLFEASDAGSFLQRFGRVGRHSRGKAVCLVPPNVFEGMRNLPARVEREDFEQRINAWYRRSQSYSWFVTTEYGMVTARALAYNMVETVARDPNVKPEIVQQFRDKVDAVLGDLAIRLGCSEENRRAAYLFKRAAAGKTGTSWVNTYRKLNRFRVSLPTVRVHDFSEQSRRGEWVLGEYDVDVLTLLKYGVGIQWNEKLSMLTTDGIGRAHRVTASDLFSDADCGIIHETFCHPNLYLWQDDNPTPVSDLMNRENHIFTVVPARDVESQLEWTVPVVRAGSYLLAFDGAALLLLEMKRRAKQSSRQSADHDLDH